MNRPAAPPTGLIGARVLVVDDEAPIARFVARALTKLGGFVECASSGHDARLTIERTQFALGLSDIRMPSMNGVEFLTWWTDHRPELLEKTVFMTGDEPSSALNADIERARLACYVSRSP